MPYRERDIMEDEEESITVVDVYDLASEIGKEFEKIIDRNGPEAVTGLMPRVISALEHLEKLSSKQENTESNIGELRATIIQLENEKIGKAEDRQRYERELEDIEERLKAESHELVSMVSRLQEENRKLSSSLLTKCEGTMIPSNGSTPEVDLKVVSRLQEVIESQRQQLHTTEKENHLKNTDIDNLKSQVDKLNHIQRELRRRQRTNASQMRSLIDERAELQAALQEERRDVCLLRQRLGLAQKENEDLTLCTTETPDLRNKVIFDRDDPNRPRFTMNELKEILYERNELKARVSDLQDELDLYVPKTHIHTHSMRSHIICPPIDQQQQQQEQTTTTTTTLPPPPLTPLTPPSSLSDSPSQEPTAPTGGDDGGDHEEEEEGAGGADGDPPPVQGPMPYEPDDAPWKKREESGIRKFFRRLFGDDHTNTLTNPNKNTIGLLTSRP